MKKLEIQLNKKNLSGKKIFLDKIEPGCIYSFPKHGFVTSRTFSEKSIFSEGRHFLNLKHLSKTEDEAVVYDQNSLHNSNSRFSLGFSEETQFGFSEFIDANNSFHQDNSGIDNALHGSMEFDNGKADGGTCTINVNGTDVSANNTNTCTNNDNNESNNFDFDFEKLPNMILEVKKVDHLPCEKCMKDVNNGTIAISVSNDDNNNTNNRGRKSLVELFKMRLGFYNRHFVNYVSKGMDIDNIEKVKENERLRLFMDGTENCLSFNLFMDKIRSLNNEDLYKDVVEFETMLLYNSNKGLFKHNLPCGNGNSNSNNNSNNNNNNDNYLTFNLEKESTIPLLTYINHDDIVIQDPVFVNGLVTIDEKSSINIGMKNFKDTWLQRYKTIDKVNVQPPLDIRLIEPLPLPFLSEWEAMRKKMVKTYNSHRGYNSNIVLNPSSRMSLNEAFHTSTLPPCGMFILEQIIRDKRATFPIRGSMAIIYDLGFTKEEIVSFMDENIKTNDSKTKEEEISSVTDLIENKWRYSSTSIRSLYPGFKVPVSEKGKGRASTLNNNGSNRNNNNINNNYKKSNTCGKGCKSMITSPIYSDKEGISQSYGCPLANQHEVRKYEGLIGDIEDLVTISHKSQKDLKDVSKVTSKCVEIMDRNLIKYMKDKGHEGVRRNRHRMPHEAYLGQLLRMGKTMDCEKDKDNVQKGQ